MTHFRAKFSFLSLFCFFIFFIASFLSAQTNWKEQESEHFKVVYLDSHSYLIPHILKSAENALVPLMKIFNYKPSEKIVINTYDVYDYGFGSATTVPHNYIRLEIESLEHGYESTPFNDRLQWILSHELVHIIVNDNAGNFEKISRTLFGKVAAEQQQPLTIPFSLITNFNRYTPRWHQEAIAVFMETWLNGGFGRAFGSFDEMYFRSLTMDNKDYSDPITLETISSRNSFLLETLFYLYGARFAAYLAFKYSSNKLISWFKSYLCDFFFSFQRKFKNIFGIDFDTAWQDFISNEKKFQNENIEKLESSKLTSIKKLSKALGWVSEAFVDRSKKEVYFAYHHPHHLAAIQKLNLTNGSSKKIATLPTPSILRVSSTAFDKNLNLIFYTTNNNQLYRDIWVLDTNTKKNRLLFKDCRIGDLTVSPKTHDLWGIMHSDGRASLVYSSYPYKKIYPLISFDYGDEIFDISISPSGNYLAAILHRNNGEQSLILSNVENLKEVGTFKYETLYSKGSPESPSWSDDGKFIYYSAYTNGVSNIYSVNAISKEIQPLSNTVIGLFKPVYLNKDSLFAFEFSTKGFIPVIIPNKKADYLPAIKYFGEDVLKKNPELKAWNLKSPQKYEINPTGERDYNSFKNLELNTIIPVVSGFQNEKVFGLYLRFSDPLVIHDLTLELGVSSFKKNDPLPNYHFKLKYDFEKRWEFNYEYNAQDFYDLFNTRKRGMTGTKISLANTHYWIYDNPLKVKQKSEIAYYKGVESINDNLVEVSEPDFIVAQTNFNSTNLRRSIGSSGDEYGNEFNAALLGFGAGLKKPQAAVQIYGEWDNYSTLFFPHNILHLNLAAGYHFKNDNLKQAQFFFGGFGNREVEDVDVHQFRDVFRFPGIPIYNLDAEKFVKFMVEFNLPPLRFGFLNTSQHLIDYADFSLFSQGLLVQSSSGNKLINIGAQLNFVLKSWFNLESTFSAGIANAWSDSGSSWEWFLSYKILKN